MDEIFIPSSQKIIDVFGGEKCYQVPNYQRPYSWDSEQIDELWDDIYTAFESDDPEYFLGSIILTRNKDSKYLDVIDGQQRLTTLIILFCVLRDLYYKDHPDNTKKNRILGRIKNIENDQDRLKLFKTQIQHQNDFEQEIIKIVDFNKKTEDRKNDKFFNTACIFKEKIENLKNSNPEKIEAFTEYLLERVRVITIECTNRSFAIKLFQVLNNRGMDLTAADLIKSYLIGQLKNEEDVDVFNHDWINIEQKAKDLGEDLTKLFTYYEYYLLASNPKKALYEELEKQFKNKDPKGIIHELKRMVHSFNELMNQKSKEIYALLYLKQDVYWKSILITAKLKEWDKDSIHKLLKLLRRLYYVNWLAEYTTSKIKQTSFNIITWIKNGQNIEFISGEVINKIIEERIAARAIRNLYENVYDTSWFKPLLALVEYQQTDESNINFIDLDKQLHVEHILPRAYAKIPYWTERFDRETADRLVNTIGNLTLLSGKKNIEASNQPFPDKVDTYDGKGRDGITGFRITQKILDQTQNNTDWTEEHINKRKEWIMDEIGRLLGIDTTLPPIEDSEEVVSVNIKEIYEKLKEQILQLGNDISIEPKKLYTAFKRFNNFVCIRPQNSQLKLWLSIPREKWSDPENIEFRDVSEIGHWGTGNYEIILNSAEEINFTMPLIKQAYELNINEDKPSDSDMDTLFEKRKNRILNPTNLQVHLARIQDSEILQQVKALREKILEAGSEIQEHYSQSHIKFRHKIDFCLIYCQSDQFWVDIKLNKELISDASLDIRPHKNPIWTHIRVKKGTDLSKLLPYIKRAYEAN